MKKTSGKAKQRAKFAEAIIDAGDHNKSEICYEYDRAMDRLARLYAFGNSLPSDSDVELRERAERLAKDDLLNFAIHCRRLLEITNTIPLAKHVRVPSCAFEKREASISCITLKSGETVWRIVNTAVHYDRLEIFSSNLPVYMLVFKYTIADALSQSRQRFRPAIMLSSNKTKPMCFELRQFVNVVCSEIYQPLIDALSAKKVYVELDMREF